MLVVVTFARHGYGYVLVSQSHLDHEFTGRKGGILGVGPRVSSHREKYTPEKNTAEH